MLKVVFQSSNRAEAELVRARLEGAGFNPSLLGAAQHSSLMPMLLELQSDVAVPENQLEAAQEFLLESRLKLDGTAATGELEEGSVCAVHEQPAVAACERCGCFLCAQCGSLGMPPLCEDCVFRAEKPRQRPRWVTLVARVSVLVWFVPLAVGALLTLLYFLRALF